MKRIFSTTKAGLSKKLTCVAVGLLVLIVVSILIANSDHVVFRSAVKKYHAGRLEEAVAGYERLSSDFQQRDGPKLMKNDALFRLAESNYHAGRLGEAIADYERLSSDFQQRDAPKLMKNDALLRLAKRTLHQEGDLAGSKRYASQIDSSFENQAELESLEREFAAIDERIRRAVEKSVSRGTPFAGRPLDLIDSDLYSHGTEIEQLMRDIARKSGYSNERIISMTTRGCQLIEDGLGYEHRLGFRDMMQTAHRIYMSGSASSYEEAVGSIAFMLVEGRK